MAKKATKKKTSRGSANKKVAPKKGSKKAAPKKTAKKAVKKTAPKKAAPKKVAKKAAPKKTAKKSLKKAATKKTVLVTAPKVTTVNPALVFDGNCEEAFHFYRSVFGGNFSYIGKFSEMPTENGQPVPAEIANRIMHVALPISKETMLIGNDSADGFGPGPATVYGNNFTISINAATKNEADRLFHELSAGGSATMPMMNTFWGSYFGVLTDKFGINWMISFGS
jgi:PhnB protein